MSPTLQLAARSQRKEKVRRRLAAKQVPARLVRPVRIGLFLAVPVLAQLLFPLAQPQESLEVRVGEISTLEVIAPFTFPVRRDPDDLERARAEAARAVPPVLDLDGSLATEAAQKLRRLGREVARPPSGELEPQELRASLERMFGLRLSPDAIRFLSSPDGPAVLDQAASYLGRALSTAIVDEPTAVLLGAHDVINVRRGTTDFYRPRSEVMTAGAARLAAAAAAAEVAPATARARAIFEEIVLPFITTNAVFNAAETDQRIARARSDVPELIGMVHKGERIIDSHQRIAPEHIRKLQSLEAYRQEMDLGGRLGGGTLSGLGRAGALCLLLAAFLLYLRMQQRPTYSDLRSLALITTLGSLTIFAAYLVVDYFGKSELLIPIAVLPLLSGILINRGVALFLAFLAPMVLVSIKGFGPEFLIASSVSGVAAVLASQNLKRRHELYLAVLVVAGVNLLTVITLGLSTREPLSEIANRGFMGILNAMLVGVAAIGLLPIFEKLFQVTTNFTLIELLDRNHPLLKRMAMEAPGTFHHSMLVSELAREAAGAVGGNPLLAQVGAYYHDIGKMQMPGYFIENQSGKNRHDSLTPTMSCLILGSHVRDGIQMARKAGLPREIIDFIPEHHGTNLMSYFYHKAAERDDNVEERDFRYPGPVPGRKETALVMLADSVEATARSLEEPTPGRIRSVVKRIIDHRLAEGQLDNSGLTLGDIARVRDTFISVLDRFFHGRIAYPEAALAIRRSEEEPRPAGAPAAGPQGEEMPRRPSTRKAARRLALADGTESVVDWRDEGEDASSRRRPAEVPQRVEERSPDDRPDRAQGA